MSLLCKSQEQIERGGAGRGGAGRGGAGRGGGRGLPYKSDGVDRRKI